MLGEEKNERETEREIEKERESLNVFLKETQYYKLTMQISKSDENKKDDQFHCSLHVESILGWDPRCHPMLS